MIATLDINLFIPRCAIKKQNPFSNISSEYFKLLLILNFSDIILPTCWNIFLLYFPTIPTNVIFSVWWWWSLRFFKHNNLIDVKRGDKSFCTTDWNLLVCFWFFDEEMEPWVKLQKINVPLIIVWTFEH